MVLEVSEILEKWQADTVNAGAVLASWDAMAESFGQRPVPTFEDNEFLQLLEREGMLRPDARVLDVGCGAGSYGVALSPRVLSVTGLDLSPRMIARGRKQAQELGLSNLEFDVCDWHALNVQKAGLYKQFDLVFARMTPAVQSYAGFKKLSDCSRGWCVLMKPIKRSDALQEAVMALLDRPEGALTGDKDILFGFTLLFVQEKCPRIEYGRSRSDLRRPLDQTIEIYLNRAKGAMNLTPAQERKVIDYLNAQAKDGFVESVMDTTTATLYWKA